MGVGVEKYLHLFPVRTFAVIKQEPRLPAVQIRCHREQHPTAYIALPASRCVHDPIFVSAREKMESMVLMRAFSVYAKEREDVSHKLPNIPFNLASPSRHPSRHDDFIFPSKLSELADFCVSLFVTCSSRRSVETNKKIAKYSSGTT